MSGAALTADDQKKAAAEAALDLVKPGMKLGLGTGSTAAHFVRVLAARVEKEGLELMCVPTSDATAELARDLGLRLSSLDDIPRLDLTVDGADEIDPHLNLIKGAGGALLREKIVAFASSHMAVIADETKLVKHLGGDFPLPVEVIPFGARATGARILEAGKLFDCEGELKLRTDEYGEPFLTDSNNLIFDWSLGEIPDPEGLGHYLARLPGVVEHGLFLEIAHEAFIGQADGKVKHIKA